MSANIGWRRGLEKLPCFAPTFELEPRQTALLIVDMQYLDAHPDYGLGKWLREHYPDVASYFLGRLAETVLPNNIKLLDFFRRNRLRVIHLTVGPELPDGSDFLSLRRGREEEIGHATGGRTVVFSKGTFEHSILRELEPQAGELVINKVSRGAFNSTGLDAVLRNLGIECLVVMGVATNSCVETTARDAADRGYKTVLVEDACATFDQALHEATLRSFATLFGRVSTTQEVIAELGRQRA